MDEAPEFGSKLLDALRTPLEEGEVRLARADGTVSYPARFQLVLAANPCPCAPAHDRDCVSPSLGRRRYLARLSGPLLDRVDLRARMFPVTALAATGHAEDTATVRARVLAARGAAAERWGGLGFRTNAEVPGPVLRTRFALPRSAVRPLDAGLRAGQLTARGADRALRVAWTLADLAGRDRPDEALAELVAQVGPVEAAERVLDGRVDEQVAAETSVRRAVHRPSADLDAAAAAGARLLTPEHPEWPAQAFAAFGLSGEPQLAPPLALWVRGPARLDELCGHAVAVVGARAATSYGAHVAGELGSGLADRGCTVVSGAAIGIDGAAHRGALGVDGPTVAVLACGVDRAYPASHQLLLERIAASGLVVSEYPPGGVPGRHRFLVRNRLIAGLAAGTVVVEAGMRSGAQRTASDALSLGRQVMAVPGPVTSAMSVGCYPLLPG